MSSLIWLVIAAIALLLMFIVAIALKNSRSHSFDKEEYQTRWLKIENGLHKGDQRSYVIAVMEADKLLDRALRELDIPGQTMGERMKKIDQKFSEANHVWYAHKIRNQLAHEQDYEINYNTASRALSAFRQALKDLGAI